VISNHIRFLFIFINLTRDYKCLKPENANILSKIKLVEINRYKEFRKKKMQSYILIL